MKPNQSVRYEIAALARKMVRGELEFVDGCRRVVSLSVDLPESDQCDPDLLFLVGVDSEMEEFPIGAVRGRWAPEALAQKDQSMSEYLRNVRGDLIVACATLDQKWGIQDACVNAVLLRGLDDFVQASDLASVVTHISGLDSYIEVRLLALRVADELLGAEFMVAGDLMLDGFVAWPLTVDASLKRIVAEWNALHRSPDLSEIVWLSLTPKGRGVAHTVSGSRL